MLWIHVTKFFRKNRRIFRILIDDRSNDASNIVQEIEVVMIIMIVMRMMIGDISDHNDNDDDIKSDHYIDNGYDNDDDNDDILPSTLLLSFNEL